MKVRNLVLAVLLAAMAAISFGQGQINFNLLGDKKMTEKTSAITPPLSITINGAEVKTEQQKRVTEYTTPSSKKLLTRYWPTRLSVVYDRAFTLIATTTKEGRSHWYGRTMSSESLEQRRHFLLSSRTGEVIETFQEPKGAIQVWAPEKTSYVYPAPSIWMEYRWIDLSADQISAITRFRGANYFLRKESRYAYYSADGVGSWPTYPIWVDYNLPFKDLVSGAGLDTSDQLLMTTGYTESHPEGGIFPRHIVFVRGTYEDVLPAMKAKGYHECTLEDILTFSAQQREPLGEVWATGTVRWVYNGNVVPKQPRLVFSEGGGVTITFEDTYYNQGGVFQFAFVKDREPWNLGGKG